MLMDLGRDLDPAVDDVRAVVVEVIGAGEREFVQDTTGLCTAPRPGHQRTRCHHTQERHPPSAGECNGLRASAGIALIVRDGLAGGGGLVSKTR